MLGRLELHQFADDPILTSGFDYWLNLPREAGLPDRRDVDPSQMPRTIFPNVALLNLICDGADAEIRLAGQEFDDNFGFSMKGKRTSELTEADYRDYMLRHFRMLIDCREAIYSESAFRWDRGGRLRTRRLLMPLSHGQPGIVAMIFKIQTWPREQMQGLPYCEAVRGASEVDNLVPQRVQSIAG